MAMTQEQMMAKIAELEAANAKLQERAKSRCRVICNTEKGTISVTGLGRFPTTLYRDQWLSLLDMEKTIRQVIEENKERLDEIQKEHDSGRATGKAVA